MNRKQVLGVGGAQAGGMPPSAGSAARWLCLVAVIWLQSVSGTNSNFPAYSSQLKQSLSLSQLKLNNLAFASDAGKLLGWFSGLAAAHLPLWLVLFIGTSLGSLGYGIQYLFVANRIPSLSYAQVFLLTILGGNSICWINTVCYVATIRYFPLHQQVAVGLTTSYQGLSASIYANVVRTAFNSEGVNVRASPSSTNGDKLARAYLLLNSLLPLFVSAIAAPLLRVNYATNEVETRDEGAGFVTLFIVTIATGVYSVMNSFRTGLGGFSPLASTIGMGVFLLVPSIIPLAASIRESAVGSRWMSSRKQRVHDDNGEITDKVAVDIRGDGDDRPFDGGEKSETRVREEVGPGEMFRKVDFWLYFFMYLLGATLGIVYLNNLGQIAESRECSRTSSLVALSSSFGFLGRLLPSLLDYLSSRRKYIVARPAIMGALMVPMTAAFFMLLKPSAGYLYTSTAVIGICTGAISCTSVSTTAELFGPKNFGINHNVLVANIPIGSLIFGYLAAVLYRHHARAGEGTCTGSDCFHSTFIIWGCLCACGTFLALILYIRTRTFYSKLSTQM